ncbi:MAG: METTL5 family protein [Methanoculleaceae archaeon]
MRLRHLEMLLESVGGYKRPDINREQYMTPPPLAARLLYHAKMRGDITGRRVCDPGCGTGMLACGAALLGAAVVVGIDIDPAAIDQARSNAAALGVDVEFIVADIRTFRPEVHFDTVVMNPPFGSQQAHADRPFIDFSLRHSDIIYGIFNAGTLDFLNAYIGGRGHMDEVIGARLTIPRIYPHHRKGVQEIPVEIHRIVVAR